MQKAKSAFWIKRKALVILALLFLAHLFFRFYGLEDRHLFGWDQIDNAWAAKNIIVDGKWPLVGMVAKQNSGFFIGPLYYYFITGFYFLTGLDPIASVYIAGVTSAFTFFVLYIFTKKLFSESVALIVVFIHTVSSFIIASDRTQWPVNFLAPVSLIIFYLLYKVITGNSRFIPYLAVTLGLSWQLNFTAIFFFIITFLSLPFFPRTREALMRGLISIPLLVLFFIPNILYDLFNKSTSSRHLNTYINEYYHGFHFTRMLQLTKDAFIEFAALFTHPFLQALRYILLPVFYFLFLREKKTKERLLFCYLIALWFFVPWVVFTVYRGEISNYYFSLTRPIVLMLLAYVIVWIFKQKIFLVNIAIVLLSGAYAVFNINQAFMQTYRPLSAYKESVKAKIARGEVVEFVSFNPESYLYFVYVEYPKQTKK